MKAAKVVLITGAAGGIGSATARAFANSGWRTLLTDRNTESLGETVAACPGAMAFSADLAEPDSYRAIINWALNAGGRLDALVNAAGIWREGPVETTPAADFDAVMNINFRALYFLSAVSIPALRETSGVIINIASDAGIQGNAGAALYCASKGAVALFSKALALELAPDGIRVNAVCPGDVDTPMLRFQAENYGGGKPEAYVERLLAGYPQGKGRARLITPDEVATFVHFLCQPAAEAITGATLSMDFGYSSGKF
jgi:NAD(P)-dependent dehydrogenase (short-subunit alcohol dehydrogenase family)